MGGIKRWRRQRHRSRVVEAYAALSAHNPLFGLLVRHVHVDNSAYTKIYNNMTMNVLRIGQEEGNRTHFTRFTR